MQEDRDEQGLRPGPDAGDAAPPRPRFCGNCGAAWQADWAQCAACATAARPGATQFGVPGVSPGGVTTFRADRGRLLPPITARPSTLGSAIALYFALLAVSVVVIICHLAGGAGELSLEFGGTAAMTAIIILWSATAARQAVVMLFRPAPARWFFLGAGAAILTFGLAFAVIEGLTRGLGMARMNYAKPFFTGGYGTATVIIMVCVQPAIFEELAFRGIVFGALQPTLSATEAVFVSAGMFMILHLSPAAFPHTFALGVIAGLMRARTGSLLPGVLMHFVHNLFAVGLDLSATT